MKGDSAASVLRHFYRHQFSQSSPLIENLQGAGGYSGANFWRIEDSAATWCLRRWPADSTVDERRIQWVHRQLARAHASGCSAVPVPVAANDRDTLVEFESQLWQLEPWMPGVANYHAAPSNTKLKNAMLALAGFHEATQTSPCRREPSSGIVSRLRRCEELFDGRQVKEPFLQIEQTCRSAPDSTQLCETGLAICERFRLLAPMVHQRLIEASSVDVAVQTIIADVWHDHILFSDDEVTGIVDFGAMRMDTPAADVARLLGSLAEDNAEQWAIGWQSYIESRPQAVNWKPLVTAFDISTTLMAGINWLQWIYLDRRQFGDLRPIIAKLTTIARRMDFQALSL